MLDIIAHRTVNTGGGFSEDQRFAADRSDSIAVVLKIGHIDAVGKCGSGVSHYDIRSVLNTAFEKPDGCGNIRGGRRYRFFFSGAGKKRTGKHDRRRK